MAERDHHPDHGGRILNTDRKVMAPRHRFGTKFNVYGKSNKHTHFPENYGCPECPSLEIKYSNGGITCLECGIHYSNEDYHDFIEREDSKLNEKRKSHNDGAYWKEKAKEKGY